MKQPNFLFLITDQHRADHVGFGGNSHVQTPHLDRLAARGTVFDRAFVANPICMPNRASIMTGRMPSVHGTRFNGISLDANANTFVRSLRNAGYRTSHIGKSHLQTICVGRDRIGDVFDYSLAEEAIIPAAIEGWDKLEDFDQYRKGLSPVITNFYGFEHAEFAILHGDQVTGHYEAWLNKTDPDANKIRGPENALNTYPGWHQVYQSALPVELHPSSYVTERTVSQIKQASSEQRPFFIHASWPDPHHPFTPPGKYWDMYDPANLPLPATFYDPHTDSMPHYQRMVANRGTPASYNVDGWSPSADQYRHALAAEYGNISLIDDGVGQIVSALEHSGQADNTIVVFTSDHGDMFGDHGLMMKHAMHYEGCIRVPLVISRPRDKGHRSSALASSLDLGQTILDLAGVSTYHGMQGCSLLPIMDNPSTSVRGSILIEEDEKSDYLLCGTRLRMRTLITNEHRLTVYQGHPHGELFADSAELINLYGRTDGRELKHYMSEQLLKQMMAHASDTPRPSYMA